MDLARDRSGRRLRRLAGAVALLALGRPAGAQSVDAPEAVARLELVAPARPRILLHGTVPIPKGIYPRPDRESPLAVVNHDPAGTLVPAQIEIVSRYPTGEADVIEVFAPVELAPEDRPGTTVSFSIVASESAVARAPKVTPRVARLLSRLRQGTFGVRARDVYGNVYWADLSANPSDPGFGSLRVLKTGPWVRERRVYSTMLPVGDPSDAGPPLPHLLGVHAYVREVAGEDEVALALRLNNGATSGACDPTPLESTLGILYWRSIALVLPEGWTAVADVGDPFLGAAHPESRGDEATNVVPIVKPYPDGHLHMMAPQAQFERRFVLVPEKPAAKASKAPEPPKKAAKAPAKGEPALQAKGKPKPPAPAATPVASPRVDPGLFDPGLAFCEPGPKLWSWSEPATARYFPQRDFLARFPFVRGAGVSGRDAIRARAARELADVRDALSSGRAKGSDVLSGAMGWAHPSWVKEQGSQGGEGIATFEGYYAVAGVARENLDELALLHRMNVCRQRQAAYDRLGDPVGYEDWLDAEGRIPFDFRLNGGASIPCFLLPCLRGPVASEQVREVVRLGLRPPYDVGDPYEPDGTWPSASECLLAWSPHDDQHYVRYTKQPMALVWLANDSMARDDLILAAEMVHLAFRESPDVPASGSPGRSLRVLEQLAEAHPHQGLPVGREEAWGIDAMCAAYSVASPEWRERNRAWFDRVARLFLDGAMSSGIVQRFVDIRLLGHTRYSATQALESLLLIHAMRCIDESVLRGVDDPLREELEKLAVRGVDYLFFGPAWSRAPNTWQPYPARPTLYLQGPRQGIGVGLNDGYASPPFCDQDAGYLPPDALGLGVEWFHPWGALSYAQQITEGTAGAGLENRYLKRTLDCGKPHKSWKELMQDFAEQASDPSYDNSANWVGLLGKVQSLERH
jgi:hypothetical protein